MGSEGVDTINNSVVITLMERQFGELQVFIKNILFNAYFFICSSFCPV